MSTHIPSFLDNGVFDAWLAGRAANDDVDDARLSPGGFKPYEHIWALPEAFELHQTIGKNRVEARTHELAGQLKEGLAKLSNIMLTTPRSSALSGWYRLVQHRRPLAGERGASPARAAHYRIGGTLRQTLGASDAEHPQLARRSRCRVARNPKCRLASPVRATQERWRAVAEPSAVTLEDAMVALYVAVLMLTLSSSPSMQPPPPAPNDCIEIAVTSTGLTIGKPNVQSCRRNSYPDRSATSGKTTTAQTLARELGSSTS
jgi:hypothetical protein